MAASTVTPFPPKTDGPQQSPGQPSDEVSTWLSAIKRAQADFRPWNDRCDRIRRRYRYENSQKVKRRQFQMLWSNIEIMRPAVYAKPPLPAVEERNKTGDPMARLSSLVLERNLQFQAEFLDYDGTYGRVRDDFLLYGRGVPRLRYYPVLETADVPDQVGGDEAGEEDEAKPVASPVGGQTPPQAANDAGSDEAGPDEPEQTLKMEHVCVDFVNRSDFIHPFVRLWSDLPWLTYRAFMSRAELIERFGDDLGKRIPLDCIGGNTKDSTSDNSRKESAEDKATIYEIWDKVNDEVKWIAAGFPDVLDRSEPYLTFKNFYPSPRPAYGTLTTDSLIPVPDYVYYQDQAEEIDELTGRIGSLQDSLKLVGFYPAGPKGEGAPEIERAVRPGFENRMVAVKSWALFTEGGKGGAPIVWLPVDQVEKVLRACVELRKQLIDDVYQITGISDILRGASEASETLGAQQLKAQWGGIRMRSRQQEIARMCAETTSMVGEIMCNQFAIETLLDVADVRLPTNADVQQAQMQAALAQQQWQQASAQAQAEGVPPPEAPPPVPDPGPTVEQLAAFLKDRVAVAMRVDIEVDSTINSDESQEKQDRVEFIQATSQFITSWGPIVAQQPDLAPLAGELLLFGVRAFRTARALEGTIEQFVKSMEQKAAQPPAQPQPDPTEQAKLELVKQQGANQQAGHQADQEQQAQKHAQDMEQSKQEGSIKLAMLQSQQAHQERTQQAEQAHKERTMTHEAARQDAEAMHQADQHSRDIESAQIASKQSDEQHRQTMQGKFADIRSRQTAAKLKGATGGAAATSPPAGGDGASASQTGDSSPSLPYGSGDPLEDKVNDLAQMTQDLMAQIEQARGNHDDAMKAMQDLAKATLDSVSNVSNTHGSAIDELRSASKKPKKIAVTKRGPDNRISEVEIS